MGPRLLLFLAVAWGCSAPAPAATGSTETGGTLGHPEGGTGHGGAEEQGEGAAAGLAAAGTGGADDALPAAGTLEVHQATDLVVLSDVEVLVGEAEENLLQVYDVEAGAPSRSWSLPAPPRDVVYDAATNTAFAALEGSPQVAKIALDGSDVDLIPVSAEAFSLAIADATTVLATIDDPSEETEASMAVLDADALEERSVLVGEVQRFVAYNGSAGQLLTVNVGGLFSQFAVDRDFSEITLLAWMVAGGNCREVVVSPDERHLAIPCGGGNGAGYTVVDFDAVDPSITYGEFVTNAYPTGAAFSEDGRFFVSFGNHYIIVFDVATHVVRHREQAGEILRVGISPSGAMIFALEESALQWFAMTESM